MTTEICPMIAFWVLATSWAVREGGREAPFSSPQQRLGVDTHTSRGPTQSILCSGVRWWARGWGTAAGFNKVCKLPHDALKRCPAIPYTSGKPPSSSLFSSTGRGLACGAETEALSRRREWGREGTETRLSVFLSSCQTSENLALNF